MGTSLNRRGEGGKEEHLPLGWVVDELLVMSITVEGELVTLVSLVDITLESKVVEFKRGTPGEELNLGGLVDETGRGREGMFL